MVEPVYQKPLISELSIISFLEQYGWYMIISAIIILYLYEKYIKHVIIQWKTSYDESTYAAKYHKDSDMLKSRLSAQDKRTQLLQEKYNKDAERHKENIQEKESKKHEELLNKLLQNVDGGSRLGSNNNSDTPSLRPEYNPLMGAGSSSSYRPPKRSACSRGGCG